MKPRRWIGCKITDDWMYLYYRVEGNFPTWQIDKHYAADVNLAKEFIRLTLTGEGAAVESRYTIRFRFCRKCRDRTLACNCQSAHWKPECKHVKWLKEMYGRAK
jgi:hypothetical protein